MTKDIIKKALGLAEKENQEKEVQRVKEIIQKHLNEIDSVAKEQAKLTKRSKILKADLADIKEGRLDRIEERQEKDADAKKHSVIVVKKIVREYRPLQPWYSPYYVDYNPSYMTWHTTTTPSWQSSIMECNSTTAKTLAYDSSCNTLDVAGLVTVENNSSQTEAFRVTGSSCVNFAKGSYNVGDHNINLR